MERTKSCKNCRYGIDYGDSPIHIYCEKGKRRKTVRKTDICKSWEKASYSENIAK